MDVLVHERIFERHPGCFTQQEIASAWTNYDFAAVRVPGEREMRIATLSDGRQIEMVGVLLADGNWLVYHAMTPPSKKTWLEIDRARRRLI